MSATIDYDPDVDAVVKANNRRLERREKDLDCLISHIAICTVQLSRIEERWARS
jgi:hypothetical protein